MDIDRDFEEASLGTVNDSTSSHSFPKSNCSQKLNQARFFVVPHDIETEKGIQTLFAGDRSCDVARRTVGVLHRTHTSPPPKDKEKGHQASGSPDVRHQEY